jgi:mannosyltransferase
VNAISVARDRSVGGGDLEAAESSGPGHRIVLWIALAIGLILRGYRLGGPSLSYDETFTVLVARLPLEKAWEMLTADGVHPPLFYLIERLMLLFGHNEWVVRLPSAILGFLTIPLMYALAKRFGGERAGILAALLIAISPLHLWYSHDARMYALLAFMAAVVMLLYDRYLERADMRRSALFASASAVAYLVHYFALFLPLVQLIHLALHLKNYARQFRIWVVLQCTAGLPLLGWLVAMYTRNPERYFGIGWIPTPSLIDLPETLINLTVGYTQRDTVFHWVTLALSLALIAAAVWSLRRRKEVQTLIVVWAFVPIVVTFLISLRRPVYVDRFLILSLPAFVMMITLGLLFIRGRWGLVAAACVVAAMAFGSFEIFNAPGQAKEDWRTAAAYLSRANPDEIIILRYLQIAVPLTYYAPGVVEPVAFEANRSITPLDKLARGHTGTWLVFWNASADAHLVAGNPPFDPAREPDVTISKWIAGEGPPLLEREDFKGVTVFHFTADR